MSGPSLRRLRRDLGLTQADMAADLEVSPSYVALLERNQRPLTAEMLLRLAQTYKIDIADLAGDGGADDDARGCRRCCRTRCSPTSTCRRWRPPTSPPTFPASPRRCCGSTPPIRKSSWPWPTAAPRRRDGRRAGQRRADPVAESRRFLAARRNSFPSLDDAAERLAQAVAGHEGLAGYLKARHNLRGFQFQSKSGGIRSHKN